tara:strand:+ start:7050 stop:7634 length:585 start_codon:yes stop_codon:yes gene_type:complete
MIRICLVGEIASGKTFVSKHFGYPVFNADQEVIKIYKNNRNCFKKLNKRFPNNIINFPISKKELRKILNKKNIKIISKIVHPYVRHSLNKFLKKNYLKDFVVLDIPLIIENNLFKKKDILIYVKTPKKIILNRLKKRGNYNKKIINVLKSQQLSINRKIKLSKFIIDNRYEKKRILKQIKKIKKIINDRSSFRH